MICEVAAWKYFSERPTSKNVPGTFSVCSTDRSCGV